MKDFKEVVKSYLQINKKFLADTGRYRMDKPSTAKGGHVNFGYEETEELNRLEDDQRYKLISTLKFVKVTDEFESLEELEKRVADFQGIENDVVEINELFKEMSDLVNEQGGQIDDIYVHVGSAADHVEEARRELVVAETYSTSRRKFVAGAVVILIVVVLVIVILMFRK